MKRRILFFLTLLFVIVFLASCDDVKLPTNNYEKVQFAFNGVEKSFKNASNKRIANALVVEKDNRIVRNRIAANVKNDALNTLFSLYSDGDRSNKGLEDLSYNEPPMIQFQYLKKVLEKIGSSYSFGTKYYDNITGTIYMDMQTGKKASESEDNKYSYVFGLAISIDIDSNDLITADVSFDINISKGNEKYHTVWYVRLDLEYDMENKTPNYKLALVDENNERDLVYEGDYTYEYDYVEVVDGNIKEWRKFDMDSSKELLKDEAHPDFDSYLKEEDFEYQADWCSWYKNDIFYKFTRVDGERNYTVSKTLFEGIGLNSTDINASSFLQKEGIQNGAIKTCYDDFSKIYGDDIIYDLITKNSDDHGNDNNNNNNDDNNQNDDNKYEELIQQATCIFAVDDNGNFPTSYEVDNKTFAEIFQMYDLRLEYCDNDKKPLIKADINNMLYFFASKKANSDDYYDSVNISYFDSIEQDYQKLADENPAQIKDLTEYNNPSFRISFIDLEHNVGGYLDFIYRPFVNNQGNSNENNNHEDNNHEEQNVDHGEDSAFFDLGIPSYFGDYYHISSTDEEGKYLITGSNERELNIYLDQYHEYARIIDEDNIVVFEKYMGEETYVVITVDYNDIEAIILEYKQEVRGQEQNQEQEQNEISIVGDFNNWDIINGQQFSSVGEGVYILTNFNFISGTKYKFVLNHSWNDGGYGYKNVQNIREYKNCFEPADSNNDILVIKDCFADVEVTIEGNNLIFKLSNVKVSSN